MLTITVPNWQLSYERGELIGGWELAGDQIGEKMHGKNLEYLFNIAIVNIAMIKK